MKGKAIVLCRVSTKIQKLDSQREAVLKAVREEGYSEKDIIIIEDIESAVKLSEEERLGLNKMKEHIEADPTINSVFVYELSRLSRRPTVLYNVRDYLASRKINLIVLNPYFRTLKEDGTIDTTSNIVFSMFGSFSENEAILSKQRQQRGKMKKIAEGRYVGSALPYGYTINNSKDKLIVINPSEAEVVRKVFQLYSTGEHSINSLVKETGLSRNRVGFMLQNCSYCGRSGTERKWGKTKTDISLPKIITEELFDKCCEVRENNPRKPKRTWNSIYFCKGLIKCVKCCRNYITKKNTASYHCATHASFVPVNLMDSFAWEIAKKSRKEKLSRGYIYDKELIKLQDSLSILQDKKNRSEQELVELYKKKDRLAILIMNDDISQELADKKKKDLKALIDKAKSEIDRYTFSLDEVNSRIEKINIDATDSPLDLDSITDETEMNNIIHEEIYSIVIMDKAERSHEVKVCVSYKTMFNDLDTDLDDSKFEYYLLNTKTNKVVNEDTGQEFQYTFIRRFTRSDKQVQKSREAYNKYRESHKAERAAYAREYRARKKTQK
jgi:DNA invertase Pin-like site-specific DNA recombinase